MSEFKAIETQEQLDAIIKDRVARAKESVRDEFKDYADLKKTVEGFQAQKQSYEDKIAELTKANEEHTSIVDGLNKRVATAETQLLKTTIALENGIPYQMAGRLNGDDEESIRKDASTFASFIATKQNPPARNPEAKSKVEDKYSNLLKEINRDK